MRALTRNKLIETPFYQPLQSVNLDSKKTCDTVEINLISVADVSVGLSLDFRGTPYIQIF